MARTIAPRGINLMSGVVEAPAVRGAPPKKPPEINNGAATNPILSAQVID
jgi:hypothetical protein